MPRLVSPDPLRRGGLCHRHQSNPHKRSHGRSPPMQRRGEGNPSATQVAKTHAPPQLHAPDRPRALPRAPRSSHIWLGAGLYFSLTGSPWPCLLFRGRLACSLLSDTAPRVLSCLHYSRPGYWCKSRPLGAFQAGRPTRKDMAPTCCQPHFGHRGLFAPPRPSHRISHIPEPRIPTTTPSSGSSSRPSQGRAPVRMSQSANARAKTVRNTNLCVSSMRLMVLLANSL